MLHAAARRGERSTPSSSARPRRRTACSSGSRARPSRAAGSLVVEDTSTTGGSPLTAVEAAREAGAEVVAVAVIADRASGAQEKIEAQALPYVAAYSVAELGLA